MVDILNFTLNAVSFEQHLIESRTFLWNFKAFNCVLLNCMLAQGFILRNNT